jgi:hypothetical protein
MIELIRQGTVPPSMLRRAAQGGLALPPGEAVEILVELSGHTELGETAQETLVKWQEDVLVAVAGDPDAPPKVLRYLQIHHHGCMAILDALGGNPSLPMWKPPEPEPPPEVKQAVECQQAAVQYLEVHAPEVKAEEQKPFELVTAAENPEEDPLVKLLQKAKVGALAEVKPEEKVELSMLQKIGNMRVGERIKLAMRGNREERQILIRDRSKLVALAVLESPKVNESEMESFASMKNIQETVLRTIAGKRNYIKNYTVMRALVCNPKVPLEVALPLLPHLQLKDQKFLSVNKNVNDTLRKMAVKIYRVRTERQKD